jgi:hypothetical protein
VLALAWIGNGQGYGRFKAGGETYMARRFAWQEMGKPDLGALTVSTRCSNKFCVRHLSTRTRAEIMASVSRRWASDEDSHLARITSRQVPPDPQALRKGQRYPERVGRALRHVGIKHEEDPGQALLETHLTLPNHDRPHETGYSQCSPLPVAP